MSQETQHATMERYLAFWNEPDAARRADLIPQVFAEGARQLGPLLEGIGADGIAQLASELKSHLPEHRFLRDGAMEFHHGTVRLPWTIVGPEGERVFAKGTDIGMFGTDGRLQQVTTFIDLFPEDFADHHGNPAADPAQGDAASR